jgi:DNA-binding PadR family transcriptional regulator
MGWHHHHRQRTRRHQRHSRRYGPWMARGRFFGPGEIRLALLSLLDGGAQHGYQLMKGLEERSGGTYRASAGSVYPTLQQLEDEGLVRSETRDGKRVYEITEPGRSELAGRADQVQDIWQRADDWESWSGLWEPEASELWRPAMRMMKAALRALGRSDHPDRVDEVREVFDRVRRELDELG